jgi:EAL domain-containing protein (putative c-di-GMP-specific phosphodiesterase class I)
MSDLPPDSAADTRLARTFEERAVSMVYQPIVDLKRRRVIAYEALVRPKHYASPVDLIEDGHRRGQIGALGRMLREAAIAACPDHPLFLNIHPDELVERYLVQPDDPIFTHSEDVYAELTEAVPLQRLALSAHVLTEIQDRGVHIVVDDLGSGYSNLRYLADLKPKVVKLDRELITGLVPATRRFTLVRALARLGDELGARVPA